MADLVGLRSAELGAGLPPASIAIPMDVSPALVVFNVPCKTTLDYVHRMGWVIPWFGPIV